MLPIQRQKTRRKNTINLTIDHLVNKLSENGATFTNIGATADIWVQLPPATIDQVYRFRTTSAYKFKILPEDTEDIQPVTNAVLTDGFGIITAGVGNEYIEVFCRVVGHWIVTEAYGTISNEAVVSHKAVAGVTAPVAGAEPDTTVTADTQWTGVTTWSPAAATFDYETVYTATITLTPKIEFTMEGVTENQFTVTGADTVTNPANSGVVTAAFPATAAEG